MTTRERQIDRLDVRPRFATFDPVRLNNMFRGIDAREMVQVTIQGDLVGAAAIVSSFGTESAVLLHLVLEVAPETPVVFIDTGRHFAETLQYRDALLVRLGQPTLITARAAEADIAARDPEGLRQGYDPDGCCDLRKTRPLEAALTPFDAIFTGRKAFQSDTRAAIPRFELRGERMSVNPLSNWTRRDIEDYFARHDLPRHPLEAQGYPSIGCAPCTTPVAPGEPLRAGRWRGFEKTECGIHLS